VSGSSSVDGNDRINHTYDPLTKSGTGLAGRKVKGTIQWVSANHAVKIDVLVYEKLLLEPEVPKEDSGEWKDTWNKK